MEAIYSAETSVDTQRITRRHIPENSTVHNNRCENLKSYNSEDGKHQPKTSKTARNSPPPLTDREVSLSPSFPLVHTITSLRSSESFPPKARLFRPGKCRIYGKLSDDRSLCPSGGCQSGIWPLSDSIRKKKEVGEDTHIVPTLLYTSLLFRRRPNHLSTVNFHSGQCKPGSALQPVAWPTTRPFCPTSPNITSPLHVLPHSFESLH
jgi:hypothetical protein